MRSIVAALAACLALGAADAAVVTRTFTLNASAFERDGPFYSNTPAAPFDPIALTFTVTLDDGLDYTNATTGLTLDTITAPFVTRFSYSSYFRALGIGADVQPNGCTTAAGTFCAFVNDAFDVNPQVSFFNQPTTTGEFYVANAVDITASSVSTSAVPEPASWGLMLGGFGLMGGMIRRRRKTPLLA